MEKKENLTNEKLRQKFKSQFELVTYAIRLAENMIRTGRDTRVKTDLQNRAMQILAEIATGKDQFDEIVIETSSEEPPPREREYREGREHREHREGREHREHREGRGNARDSFESFGKNTERKKARKILAD